MDCKFKQGDIVKYTIDKGEGRAKVVGLAIVSQAGIGFGIILEDLSSNFPSNEYPYSHFLQFEVHLTKE